MTTDSTTNGSDEVVYYRRRLPHIHPANATFFVTTRLAGSLPDHVIASLKEEQRARTRRLEVARNADERKQIKHELQQRYFGRFDQYVDQLSLGPRWLQQPEVSQCVVDALHYRDGKFFDLLCYTIMPNHTHVVFSVQRNGISLNRILQALNRRTARECNRILGRTGAFWHHESYDHVVRDGAELESILQYILLNPVKAKLCRNWNDWEWSYIKKGLSVLD